MSSVISGTSESGNKCPNCGSDARPEMSFCSSCGTSLKDAPGSEGQNDAQATVTDSPESLLTTPPSPSADTLLPPPPPPPPMQPLYHTTNPPYQQPDMTVVQPMMARATNNGLCVAAMVLGIIAVVFFWAPFFGIVLGVLATIFGAVGIPASAKKAQAGRGMGIAGLILGIIALAINIILIVTVYGFLASNA